VTKTPTLFLRRACGAGDVDLIYRWRAEVVDWLATRPGPRTDQWSYPYPRRNVERWVERGETYMASLYPGGDPVATITSSTDGDPNLWTPEERAVPARYVSKLTVARDQTGREIGAGLVAWARTDAARAGAEVVRIDVWSTNEPLHAYYRGLGFEYRRTVAGVWPPSGALFEVPAAEVPHPVVELLHPFASDHPVAASA
jgi:ribosomal protein S18 acetylase RimI-like enzyme